MMLPLGVLRTPLLAILAAIAFAGAALADVGELIGERAPDVRARLLESDVEIDPLAGGARPVVLAFVATWCGACRDMQPELDRIRGAYDEQALGILRLSHETRGRLRAHAAAHPSLVPLAQCTGRTAVRYQAVRLPTLVVVDGHGRVHAAYQGAGPRVVRALRRAIEEVTSE